MTLPSGFQDMLEPSAVSQLLEKTLKGDNSTLQHGLTVLVAVMKHCTNANRTIPEQNVSTGPYYPSTTLSLSLSSHFSPCSFPQALV